MPHQGLMDADQPGLDPTQIMSQARQGYIVSYPQLRFISPIFADIAPERAGDEEKCTNCGHGRPGPLDKCSLCCQEKLCEECIVGVFGKGEISTDGRIYSHDRRTYLCYSCLGECTKGLQPGQELQWIGSEKDLSKVEEPSAAAAGLRVLFVFLVVDLAATSPSPSLPVTGQSSEGFVSCTLLPDPSPWVSSSRSPGEILVPPLTVAPIIDGITIAVEVGAAETTEPVSNIRASSSPRAWTASGP